RADDKIDIKKCPAMLGLTGPAELKNNKKLAGTIELTSVETRAGKYRYTQQERSVVILEPQGTAALAIRSDRIKQWVKVDVEKGVARKGELIDAMSRGDELAVWAKTTDGNTYRLTTFEAAPKPARKPPEQWCVVPPELDGHERVCFEEDHGRLTLIAAPRNHFLSPNTSTVVLVRHSTAFAVSITMGGTAGLTAPAVANFTTFGANQQAGGAAAAPPEETVTTVAAFAPRKPGSADIKVELHGTGDPATVVAEQTLELLVEQGYLGAIRLGIGVVGSNA